ncbi:MAG: prepilin peptidase [Elusimicrobia bacterium]|nr:prepilin peptidase [Elusimicrobiota bacterium]
MTALACYAFLLALGAAASFQDWRERKIRNRLILAGLAFAAAAAGGLFLNSLAGHWRWRLGPIGEFYLPARFYPRLALHAALSLGAGFLVWRLSVWPAGDAKLFALLALLAALVDPNLPGFPSYLFLLLLINIFVPAGLVFAVETVAKAVLRLRALGELDWRVWPKAKAEMVVVRLRDLWPHRFDYFVLAVNLLALFLGLQAAQARFFRAVAEPGRSLGTFAFAFVCWQGGASVLRDRRVGLAAFAALCAAAAGGALFGGWPGGARLRDAARMTLNFGLLLSFGRLAFDWFIERDSLRELPAEQVELGTVLADQTWSALSAEKELAGRMGARCVDGLTEQDARTLKAWLGGKGAPAVAAYRTIPFAFWIFLGTLLTLSSRANAVALLAPWLGRARAALAAALGGGPW